MAGVVTSADLDVTAAALAERRGTLLARGIATRTAAFSSPAPGEDIVRLASQENVDLLLVDAGPAPLDGETGVVLEQAPCDVAMQVEAGGPIRPGPVMVPFGAAWHDWAALELGAWVAQATGAPLRLIGAASDGRENGRDASRLLADASLIVQRSAGVVAEPLLGQPRAQGRDGRGRGRRPARGRALGSVAPGWPRPGALGTRAGPAVRRRSWCAGARGPARWRRRRPGPASAGR